MALNQEFQMKISFVAVTCIGIIAVTVKELGGIIKEL